MQHACSMMNKTILITGASTGIGAAAAKHLAPGNTLILHHHRTPITAAAEAAKAAGARVVYTAQADLATEAGCQSLMDAVEACANHLDALVNNAGALLERHTVDTLRWEVMERIFALNTFSAMMLTQRCAPLLRKGTSPSIVNLTSIAARHGAPTATIYGAAKAALDSFTRGAARELAPVIRVNAVAPGVIVTPFHDKYTPAERMRAFEAETPVGFNGAPEHIATAIAFLIENTFTTGETIDVNGGLFMR